jgi:hypothetical protein
MSQNTPPIPLTPPTRDDGAGARLPDAELECFIDGALAPARTLEIERILAASPAAAARLARVRDIDDLARGALLAPAAGAPAAPVRAGHRPIALRMAAAAAFALVGGAVAIGLRSGPSRGAPPGTFPVAVAHVDRPSPPARSYEPVRVVLRLPLAPGAAKGPKQAVKTVMPGDADPQARARTAVTEIAAILGDPSDAGIKRAVAAINDASPRDRAAALAALGQTLRSGSTAVRILDRLEARDQVAVCGELALDTSLRSVALQRLRDLTENPVVGPDARATVRALAAAPGMKVWLRSYGLLDSASRTEPAPG